MDNVKELLKDQATTGKLIKNFEGNTHRLGKSNLSFDALTARLDTLEKYWTTYYDRHMLIARHEEELPEEPYFIANHMSETEVLYSKNKSFLQGRVAELTTRASDNTSVARGTTPVLQLSTTATSLPKLTLPKFSGQQSEWDSFKALFASMVKDAPTLTPTLKLQHLLTCVEGEALRTIKNIDVTGENFDVAWTALSRRYEKKRLRISVYMKRLLHMPKATKKSVAEITRLLDTTNECRRGLSTLGEPVDQWDRWFVSLIVFNLDENTRELWEQHLPADESNPTYDDLVKYLENKAHALDTANCPDPDGSPHKSKNPKDSYRKPARSVSSMHTATANQRSKCLLCSAEHRLGNCPDFLAYSIDQRWKYARDKKLCYNCLSKAHRGADCQSSFKCRTCKQPHHTKLHREKAADAAMDRAAHTTGSSDEESLVVNATTLTGTTLLGTAEVIAVSPLGEKLVIRALIDPASEGSFVTERVAQALSLKRTSTPLTVTGVAGHATASVKSSVCLSLQSKAAPKLSLQFSAAVLPKLSSLLPKRRIDETQWQHLEGLELADPAYGVPSAIDCLIGAEMWPDIIRNGLHRGPAGSPAAYKTVFGWVITGPTTLSKVQQQTIEAFNITLSPAESVSNDLRRFWEIEEISEPAPPTAAELLCEDIFNTTHKRDASGRYCVTLPFVSKPELPGSYVVAKQRFLSLERRLLANTALRDQYAPFMHEYEVLGHMRRVKEVQRPIDVSYLPHHAVVTKKLRVVFNASQKATNGRSLNDYLHVGKKLQQDISTILLRWRMGRFAFTADIVKMYRQIAVNESDVAWQRILWRCKPEEPLHEYDLLTVTYGTACAPYLALRVLLQLADDEQQQFSAGAAILKHHMYVDDALVSCDTEEDAVATRTSLTNILQSAGMKLDKWASNCPSLIPTSQRSSTADRLFHDHELSVPTLGLRWTPSTDAFSYSVPALPTLASVTKRIILSEVARIYDPTGWLTPVTVRAKILLQSLWLQGHDWDQLADETTTQLWLDFRRKLATLQTCTIPRWLGISADSVKILHGFSDASEKAYAAAVYLVSDRSTHLLAAKSKVAPLQSVSLPRLELCGSTLLARLMVKVARDIDEANLQMHCWTDSQIVLAWLRAPPSNWKAFVANRVSEIHRSLPNASWHHVASKQNPADVASRGCSPELLEADELWWKGPASLSLTMEFAAQPEPGTKLEKRAERACFLTTDDDNIETLLNQFSSFNRLLRVTAFCLRWRSRASRAATYSNTILSVPELATARSVIIRAVQAQYFGEEIRTLQRKNPDVKSAQLRRHRPFLDDDGLLRVGGRLQHAVLPYQERHPVIIPKTSHIAQLLINHAHDVTMHGGPQLVQSFLLRRWWILHARSLIRRVIHSCIRCARYQGRKQQQLMAPLSEARVTPSRPFLTTGLDYAGPFAIRTSKGRGQRSTKGYVAVFVCLVTRAVHLEVVSDYSTKTFLLALRRFFARRGLSRTLYSDCGTTFQGAANELQQLFHSASSFSNDIQATLSKDEIQWTFIPPRAPHFGGLWEAAVKSFKTHLKRVVGATTLTFEEFSTLATQIESCLNSRPLAPLSSDPQDVAALTPRHFLVGGPLLAAPEPFSSEELNGIPRWNHTIHMRNHFWRRWQNEVLRELQLRQKWHTTSPDVQPGDLILLTDDLQPPQRWPLARIEAVHPGADGLVRVVTLRTATTTLKRPIAKIIRLPIKAATPPIALAGADAED